MSDAPALEYLTEEEYRVFELASEERPEYVDGIVRLMTGTALRHNSVPAVPPQTKAAYAFTHVQRR